METITIQGIKIGNEPRDACIRQMHDYFDFPQLYQIICEQGFNYRLFVEGLDVRYMRLLLGPKKTNEGDLDFVDMAEDAQTYMESQTMSYCTAYRGFYQVRVEAVLVLVRNYYKILRQGRADVVGDWPDVSEMEAVMREVLTELTKDGARCFSPQGAVELFIYCILHTAFGILPKGMPESGYEALRDDLNQSCPVTDEMLRTDSHVVFSEENMNGAGSIFEGSWSHTADDGRKETGAAKKHIENGMSHAADSSRKAEEAAEKRIKFGVPYAISSRKIVEILLEYYAGGSGDVNMKLVQLENKSDAVCNYRLGETVVSASVPAHSSVYALQKDGAYIGFLPRVALCGANWIQKEKNGSLRAYYDGRQRHLELETDMKQPAAWAYCNEFGTFVVDAEGRLDTKQVILDCIPQKKVVFVSAFGLDYCILMEDGSVICGQRKKDWEHLISAKIGWDYGIALDDNRIPILDDGRRLEDFHAVAAACGKNHYICLDADGGILTDSGLYESEPAFAVAVCFGKNNSGYAAAFRNYVRLYSFENCLLKQWDAAGVNEMEASDKLLVWRTVDAPGQLQVKVL